MVIVGACRVVTTKNIVHAALYLVVVLAGVGGACTSCWRPSSSPSCRCSSTSAPSSCCSSSASCSPARRSGATHDLDNDQRLARRARRACSCSACSASSLDDAFERHQDRRSTDAAAPRAAASATRSSQTYVIPFEVVSVLLLAALVGAIVIARTGLIDVPQRVPPPRRRSCSASASTACWPARTACSCSCRSSSSSTRSTSTWSPSAPTGTRRRPGLRPVRHRRRRRRGRRRPRHRPAHLPQPPIIDLDEVDLMKG